MFTAFIKILPVGELAEHFHLATTNTNGGQPIMQEVLVVKQLINSL